MRYHTTYTHHYCPVCKSVMIHFADTYECRSCSFTERSKPRKLIPINQYSRL